MAPSPAPVRNSCAPRSDPAQRLLAADLSLRRSRGYQRLRLTVLGLSLAIVLGGPLWVRAFGERALVGAPFTVRLFGLELLDPVAAVVALAARPASALPVLVGVAPTLLLVALFGRFFCGWICPYLPVVAASNATRFFFARFGVRLPDVKVPRG